MGGDWPLLWLCGPSGVGKTSAGWEIFTQLSRAGIPTGYLDADQLGLCYPSLPDDPGNHRVKARNLGAMARALRAAGARCLVLSGGVSDPGTVRACADAVPGSTLTLVRLHASPAQLRERILLRGRGGGPAVPGDELKGRSAEYLLRYADESAREAAALERAGIGELRVGTDGRTSEDIAQEVSAAAAGTADPAAAG